MMPTGSQNGAEIIAETPQQCIHKTIAKKESKSIKDYVFLKGSKLDFERITPYCCSKTRVARFGSGAMSVCKNDENSMTNPSPNRCQINDKSMQNPYSKK
jgi:hypothetical protein